MHWLLIVSMILAGMLNSHPVLARTGTGAFEVYKAFFETAEAGGYAREGFVFLIAEVPLTDKSLPRGHYEGRAMRQAARLMRNWLTADVKLPDWETQPLGPLMAGRVQELVANEDYVSLNLTDVKARILENRPRERVYRYVVAVEERMLSAEKERLASAVTDAGFFEAQVFQRAWRDPSNPHLPALLLEAGLAELALYARRQALKTRYPLTSYYVVTDPFHERATLRHVLQASDATDADTVNLLASLPAAYEILTPLARAQSAADPLAAMIFTLTALPDTVRPQTAAAMAFLRQHAARLSLPAAIEREFAQRLDVAPNNAVPPLSADPVWRAASAARGWLEFDPSLAAAASREYAQARTYFDQGIHLPEIIQLLLTAIESTPRHTESWQYLGAALAAQEMFAEALIANRQALQLAGHHLTILANLAYCLQELGFRSSAYAKARYIAMVNQPVTDPYAQTISQQILQRKDG